MIYFFLAVLFLIGSDLNSSGFRRGRPIFTFAKISKTDLSYIASLVTGFSFAVSILFLTASSDMPSSAAISDTVNPSIFILSAIIAINKESIHSFRDFTKRLFSENRKKNIKISNNLDILLDKVSNILDTKNIRLSNV